MIPSFDPSVESLVENELGLDRESIPRAGQDRIVNRPGDRLGLSLSGGGIRSATFNLGLLQGLHDVGLLRSVDYLSTVSGGGYVGSFWTAWRSRPEAAGSVFPEPGPDDVEPPEVRHLREFAGFLAPRFGIFNWETWRMLVAATGSILPSLLAALSVMALVFLAWVLGVHLLFARGWATSTLVLTGSLGLLLAVAEANYRRRREPTSRGAYLIASLVAVAVTGGGWFLLWRGWDALGDAYAGAQRLPVIRDGQRGTDWLYLLAPSIVFLTSAVLFSLRRWFASRFERGEYRQLRRAAFDRVHGRLLFAVVAWIVVATVWFLGAITYAAVRGDALWGTALGGITVGTIAAFAWLHRKLNVPTLRAVHGKLLTQLAPILPRILSYAAVGLMAVCTVAILISLDAWLPSLASWLADAEVAAGEQPPINGWPLAIPALACIAIIASVLFFMDPNEVGLHAFYKGRIARAYTGASNAAARGEDLYHRRTEEQPGDDLRFAGARTPTGQAVPESEPRITRHRPVHLVCCAANDLSADPVATLNRGAVSAVLTPAGFSVGREWAPWEAQIGAPTLAHAATASGAAFNSLMGAYSVEFGPAATFLMAALNLRLGLWLPHPTRASVHQRRQKLLKRWMVGLPFFKELVGAARADGQDVHLSDGGHFENLGTYELIRRHCRFIIAADSSADPEVRFNDFGNLVRRVREDFGVDIRIDLSPFEPEPGTGRARQPMVAGDIHYPEGDTGILLLFKPTITGTEPADIAQYRARNPVFPHDSTIDQFFDDAQWESYRRLGQHAAYSAFHPVAGGLNRGAPDYGRRLVARARREWQPEPPGFGLRLARFTDRAAEVDAMLRKRGSETLLRQVYKEVDELDRQAKVRVDRVVGDGAKKEISLPSGAELAASLHVLRVALLMMDEVFETEDLDQRYNHPLYLGVMNYFARWAYAPLFRLWWPLLKALYPQPFTRFMEERFGLATFTDQAADDDGIVSELSQDAGGFAWECWHLQGNDWPAHRRVVSYNLRMQYPGVRLPYHVQAGQVVADLALGNEAMVWDAADFFVPPGLWGIGIGEDFLRRMASGYLPFPTVNRLYVCVRADGSDSATAKKAAANEVQLYRSAGFSEILAGVVPLAVVQALQNNRPWGQDAADVERWMVLDVAGAERPGRIATEPVRAGRATGA